MPTEMVQGEYRIFWTVAGRDGHLLRGTINFSVLPPLVADVVINDSLPPIRPAVIPPATQESLTVKVRGYGGYIMLSDLVSPFIRWLSFLLIFLVIGVVTFRFGVIKRMGSTESDLFTQIASGNAATLGIVAAVGAVLVALLKATRGMEEMPGMPGMTMMTGSWWGLSLLIQAAAGTLAVIAFFMVHRSNMVRREGAWKLAAVAAAALALSPSLAGHATSSEQPLISIPADFLHVAAGSMWLGTLAVIVIVGLSAALKAPDAVRPGARVAAMINAFSPLALTFGGTVVATGVIASLIHVPSVSSLWTTAYGVTLLLKLFFVALLFGAGAWNWRRMKPRLTGDDAIGPMRSSASLELVLAMTVLALTAILVAMELP